MPGSCLDVVENKAKRGVKMKDLEGFNGAAGVLSVTCLAPALAITAPIYWCMIGGCCYDGLYNDTLGPGVSGARPTDEDKKRAGLSTFGRVCSGVCAIVVPAGPCVSQWIHEGKCCLCCYRQESYAPVGGGTPPQQTMD